MAQELATDPCALVTCIADHNVSHLLAVPQLLSAVASTATSSAAEGTLTASDPLHHESPPPPSQLHIHGGRTGKALQLQQPIQQSNATKREAQTNASCPPRNTGPRASRAASCSALAEPDTLTPSPLRSLTYIASSGDALPLQHVRRLQGCISSEAVLLNIYGSAETTADCLFHQVLPDSSPATLQQPSQHTDVTAASAQFAPLGLPMGCTEAYLLPWDDNTASAEIQCSSKTSERKRKRDR
jgi:hypothetical protein